MLSVDSRSTSLHRRCSSRFTARRAQSLRPAARSFSFSRDATRSARLNSAVQAASRTASDVQGSDAGASGLDGGGVGTGISGDGSGDGVRGRRRKATSASSSATRSKSSARSASRAPQRRTSAAHLFASSTTRAAPPRRLRGGVGGVRPTNLEAPVAREFIGRSRARTICRSGTQPSSTRQVQELGVGGGRGRRVGGRRRRGRAAFTLALLPRVALQAREAGLERRAGDAALGAFRPRRCRGGAVLGRAPGVRRRQFARRRRAGNFRGGFDAPPPRRRRPRPPVSGRRAPTPRCGRPLGASCNAPEGSATSLAASTPRFWRRGRRSCAGRGGSA